jgi:8-oxo-dGTP pyrophosphatase MutT (NUDIX family)
VDARTRLARLTSSEHVLQAAAIPYRWQGGRLQIALITKRQTGRWIVPKGHVEPGETPRQSARREASEEAGLLGRVGLRPLGHYEYIKDREPHVVLVFLLLVTKELRSWREDDVREREWIGVEQAIKRVRERGLRHLLRGWARRTA